VHQRHELPVADRLQLVDGPCRRRRRVVELVGEARGERSERDEGVTLTRHGVDHAHRLEEALDQVEAEGEPGPDELAERGRRHTQDAAGVQRVGGGEVADRVGPCLEAARPEPRAVHHGHGRDLVSRSAEELDPAVEQNPPELGGLALAEEHVALVEGHDVARVVQLAQLLVAQPGEQEQRP
jgi:hypothetical protein